MLFSPVYIESHPRRNAANAASSIPLESFNFFTFNGFRTLLHNGRPQSFSLQSLPDSFYCNGGVPPLARASSTASSPISFISRHPSHFSSTAYKMLFQQLLCFDNHPFSWGVYTPPHIISSPGGKALDFRADWQRFLRVLGSVRAKAREPSPWSASGC
jgi:hypothetical protein